MTIHCCIGVMVYNEEANIGRLIEALLQQETMMVSIDSIIVVASGCTDRTEDIVTEFVQEDPRVRLIKQDCREGKASAVNLFLRNALCDILVLHSADTVPGKDTIEKLIRPFAEQNVGMTGGRPIPVNKTDNFMGYGVNFLWNLHHRISLVRPKMGELIAFRQIFRQIPFDTAVDEASIEPLIIGQGLKLIYVPEAIVYNRGPENIKDYFKQRRRIFTGHLYVKETLGYKVSTMNSFRLTCLYFQDFRWDWRYLFWAPAFCLLEAIIRTLAVYDYYIMKRNPFNWSRINSTKSTINLSDINQHEKAFHL